MANPLVSVVMAVFNCERFVDAAVESILNQTFDDFEFIIIDDGSTDETPVIIDKYRLADPRVRPYHQENKGLIVSLNRGCYLARGDYIARMDADDISLPNRLNRQIEFLRENPQVGLLGGAVELIDGSGQRVGLARYPVTDSEIRCDLLDGSVFWHPTTMFRSSTFNAVGGYRNIAHAEDYDLWLRMAEACEVANLDSILLKYRVHSGQVSVRHCRAQALSTVAVKVAASFRRGGQSDPFGSANTAITPETLIQLGVTEQLIHTTLARGQLACVRNMIVSRQYALARQALQMFTSADVNKSERWVRADLQLESARLSWREGNRLRAIGLFCAALRIRPVISLRALILTLRRFVRRWKPTLAAVGQDRREADYSPATVRRRSSAIP